MTVGRLFRRMGLPFWTFLGIGISAIWFQYLGVLLEEFFRDALGLTPESTGLARYLPPLFVFLSPFLFVLVAWAWQRAYYPLVRLVFPGGHLPQPTGKKGLILLVSRPEHALYAVRYHLEKGTLTHVWLIPSNDSEQERFGKGTQGMAQEITDQCAALSGGRLSVQMLKAASPADAQDTFDVVNRVYRQSGLEPGEIIADFTGGTKPMTVGMIMACLPVERELEYVPFNPESKTMHGPFLIDYQHNAFDLIG